MAKKYRHKGVKREHHVIEGFAEVYECVAGLSGVKSVIPGRITRSGGGRVRRLSVQYRTETGLKCLAKGVGSIQEVFVVTDEPDAVAASLARCDPGAGGGVDGSGR